MPYKFIEGYAMADVTYEATGKTLEEVFESAGRALTRSMVENPEAIEPKTERKFELKAKDEEMLLHNFLQEIVFYKDAEMLIFNEYELMIKKEDGGFVVEAILRGEEIDTEKHMMIVDVKAVSWHMFKLEKENEWRAFVILDV